MGFADGTDDKPYDPWEDDEEGPSGDGAGRGLSRHRRPAGPYEQADATGLSGGLSAAASAAHRRAGSPRR